MHVLACWLQAITQPGAANYASDTTLDGSSLLYLQTLLCCQNAHRSDPGTLCWCVSFRFRQSWRMQLLLNDSMRRRYVQHPGVVENSVQSH